MFIATGFDRNATGKFLRRRIELLSEVQNDIGHPLSIVLNCVLTRLPAIQYASRFFPGRVHLLGQSVFQRSVKGSTLALSPRQIFTWEKHDTRFSRGTETLRHNMKVLEEAIATIAPDFYLTEAA